MRHVFSLFNNSFEREVKSGGGRGAVWGRGVGVEGRRGGRRGGGSEKKEGKE